MKGVVFDLSGSLAHFRKPDTTATHMTYPFITPLAVKGLVGAILGLEDFITKDKVGIRLMKPVKTISQQMSMLGKDAGSSFNRPTTIELVISPYYRIYYAGYEYADQLVEFLQKDQAVYPTYLGAAYALTKPKLIRIFDTTEKCHGIVDELESKSIVPSVLIKDLCLRTGSIYCRAGGFLYEYKGNRTFEKSIDFIYEQEGKSIYFKPVDGSFFIDPEIRLFGKEVVCLC